MVAFPAAATGAAREAPKTRSVLYVDNNRDGTADVIQPRKFKNIARINIIPPRYTGHIPPRNTLADQLVSQRNA